MKTNIFFYISRFTFGGAGNAIYTFLNNLDRKKFNLHIFFLGKSEYKKILPKHVMCHSIEVKSSFFKTFFSFFKIRKILINKMQNSKKNIFISNIHYSNVLTILFLRGVKNLKIILFERTSIKELDIFKNIVSFIKNKIVKFLIKPTYSKANKILSNSINSSLELKKLGLKSKVIYSGSIENLKRSKKNKKKMFLNMVAVGRLTAQKDYFTLLKAIKLSKYKKFKVNIYGDGELKNKMIKYIVNKKIKKYVNIKGHETDKDKIYRNADLLIHTAIFEGLPNVIVEAMNYSVPVIASDCYGGTKEVLGFGKYGELFEPENCIELAKKIDNFILNPDILNQKILKSKSILKKFTHKSTTKSLEKILISI